MVLQALRLKGPVLVLDAGNALFRTPALSGVEGPALSLSKGPVLSLSKEPTLSDDRADKERATFILSTMGKLGTAAMPAGMRDLSAGIDFLKKTAAASKVSVLSVNLEMGGKLVFPASLTTTVNGLRVGIVGVSPPGKVAAIAGAQAGPITLAVAEAGRLRPKVDVVVVLAAISYVDALQLAKQASGSVDFVLQSSESRGEGNAQQNGEVFVFPTGERGRQLGQLELQISGKGAFFDLSQIERSTRTLELIERQKAEAERRLQEAIDPTVKMSLATTLAHFEERAAALRSQMASAKGSSKSRTLTLSFTNLGADVPDDPALKAVVAKLEPHPPDH